MNSKFFKPTAFFVFITFLITGINPVGFANSSVPEIPVSAFKTLSIPAEFGEVTDSILGSPAAPALIHIQSAHGSYEAEKNIEHLLEHVENNSSVKIMLLEGAANKLQPDLFKLFPKQPELNRKVTDKLMQEGYLTGPEAFLVDASKKMSGYGIENLDAYKKDRNAFIEVVRADKTSQVYLAQLRTQLERRFSSKMSKDLRAFIREQDAYEAKELSFEGWLKALKDAAAKNLQLDLSDAFYQTEWPFLIRFFRLQEIGAKVDRKKALNEANAFVAELKKNKISKDIVGLFTTLLQTPEADLVKTGGWTTKRYSPLRLAFDRAFTHLPRNFSMKAWPAWTLYAQHVILMQELEGKGLQDEMLSLQNRLLEALAKIPDEKKFVEQSKNLQLLKKLFRLELTRQEWEEFSGKKISPETMSSADGAKNVESTFQSAIRFYETAITRENKMIQNTVARMQTLKQNRAVIVTGGFHADGLKKFAASKGYSYLQITPRIREVSPRDHEIYLRSILGSRVVETSQMSALLGLDRPAMTEVLGPDAAAEWRSAAGRVVDAAIGGGQRTETEPSNDALEAGLGLHDSVPVASGRSEVRSRSEVREWFPSVKKVRYVGPNGRSDKLAFQWYDATAKITVNGVTKTMSEWLNFSAAAWHLNNPGGDPFGPGTKHFPWLKGLEGAKQNAERMKIAKRRVDAMFEFLVKAGITNYAFHDRDLAPEGRNPTESKENLWEIARYLKKQQKRTGVKLLWGTANLFSHEKFMNGAATNPDMRVILSAAGQVKEALEVTQFLGGNNYVLWGGREGYASLLNTSTNDEKAQLAAFLKMVRDHAREIGWKGKLLIEPKPHEPTGHQYDHDVETVIGFLKEHGLQDDFALNIESNHATLAGKTFMHELQIASDNGMLQSIDANSGGNKKVGIPAVGWDTDMFPDTAEAIEAMIVILRQGGFPKNGGGVHFDAKAHRTSTDLEDMFHAHILGMDSFAKALIIAASYLGDANAQGMLKKRYEPASPVLKKAKADLKSGALTLEAAAELDATLSEATQQSGQLEVYERFLEQHWANAPTQFMAAQSRRKGRSGRIGQRFFENLKKDRFNWAETRSEFRRGAVAGPMGVAATWGAVNQTQRSEFRPPVEGENFTLGINASTQSITFTVLDTDSGKIVWTHQEKFSDQKYEGFGAPQGHIEAVTAVDSNRYVTDPLMVAAAFEEGMQELKASGLDLLKIRAVSPGAQQHATIFLTAAAVKAFSEKGKEIWRQIKEGEYLALPVSPIWRDTSAAREKAKFTAHFGSAAALLAQTGSEAQDRFPGPQIDKIAQDKPEVFENTATILNMTAFIGFLLSGKANFPWDEGDALPSHLVDVKTRRWLPSVDELVPGLAAKLPEIQPTAHLVGTLSPYWANKYGFSAETKVANGSGDNPAALLGMGILDGSTWGVSLGSSFTAFQNIATLEDLTRALTNNIGNVMGSPLGAWMKLICFQNGGLALEDIRNQHITVDEAKKYLSETGIDGHRYTPEELARMSDDESNKLVSVARWAIFEIELSKTNPGNEGAMMITQNKKETAIAMAYGEGQIIAQDLDPGDRAKVLRAAAEGQIYFLKYMADLLGVKIEKINLTGGVAKSLTIRQIVADIFNVPVRVLKRDEQGQTVDPVSLGMSMNADKARYDAEHLDAPISWIGVTRDTVAFEDPITPKNAEIYARFFPKFKGMVDAVRRSEFRDLGEDVVATTEPALDIRGPSLSLAVGQIGSSISAVARTAREVAGGLFATQVFAAASVSTGALLVQLAVSGHTSVASSRASVRQNADAAREALGLPTIASTDALVLGSAFYNQDIAVAAGMRQLYSSTTIFAVVTQPRQQAFLDRLNSRLRAHGLLPIIAVRESNASTTFAAQRRYTPSMRTIALVLQNESLPRGIASQISQTIPVTPIMLASFLNAAKSLVQDIVQGLDAMFAMVRSA